MKLWAVLERSGGWGGTDINHDVHRVFRTEAEAHAYIARTSASESGRAEMWEGSVHEVELTEPATDD